MLGPVKPGQSTVTPRSRCVFRPPSSERVLRCRRLPIEPIEAKGTDVLNVPIPTGTPLPHNLEVVGAHLAEDEVVAPLRLGPVDVELDCVAVR
jgi:hypothetical protein